MSHRTFKDRLYPQFARIGAALASEKRLELLDLLAQAPRHVDALAAETGMSVANVSQHLQQLRHARLVETERDGTKVRYRLAGDDVLRLWLALRTVAETRLTDIDHVVHEFAVAGATEPPLSRDALAAQVQRGDVVLIDVRPPLEYGHGHLPGAPTPAAAAGARARARPVEPANRTTIPGEAQASPGIFVCMAPADC